MENGSKILNLDGAAPSDDSAGPQLLLQTESRFRVFISNLGYTILGRWSAPVSITSAPAPYWPDVFVSSKVPWWALLESALWHMVGVVLLVGVSGNVARHKIQLQPLTRSGYITYYPQMPTFPARGSSQPSRHAQPKGVHKPAEPPAMHVAQQTPNENHALVAPPDIAELTKRPELPNAAMAGGPAPAMPLSATTAAQLKGLPGPAAMVGPPPEVQRAASWREGAMQVSVVAPQPEVRAASSRHGTGGAGRVEAIAPAPQLPMHERRGGSGSAPAGVGGLNGLVVPPAPSVKRAGGLGRGAAGFGGGSGLAAVPPAPLIEGASGSTGRGGTGLPGSSGLAAVPPPPSVEGAGAATARGGLGISGGSGLTVVPPAPGLSIEAAAGSTGRRAGLGLGAGSGAGVVPPAPSVDGTGTGIGGATGRTGLGIGGGPGLAAVPPAPALDGGNGNGGAGSHRRGGMGFSGGSDLGAVPPAPSAEGAGGGNERGRGGFGGGSDLGAVPPAPSAEGAGGGNGRGGMGFGDGSGLQAVPPAPSMGGGSGSSGRGGNLLADSNLPVVPPPPSTDDANKPSPDQGLNTVVEELHMRIVGLAFATPRTSFSSTYEVFIAERQLASHAVQLIKLVYWFLPYQQRLSDYHPDYSKMYKLRATRDAACDESLVHMTVSATGQTYSSAQLSTLSPGFPSGNRDILLPCYRTTAEDYRKALSRTH